MQPFGWGAFPDVHSVVFKSDRMGGLMIQICQNCNPFNLVFVLYSPLARLVLFKTMTVVFTTTKKTTTTILIKKRVKKDPTTIR